jgi:hypothetical protein
LVKADAAGHAGDPAAGQDLDLEAGIDARAQSRGWIVARRRFEVPLSLRERAGVRGCQDREWYTKRRFAAPHPHPNPLPEGEGGSFDQSIEVVVFIHDGL